jgi:hypothetical protein
VNAPILRELQKKLWKADATTLADATHLLGAARANKHAHLVQFVEAACRERDKPQTPFLRS